jgi:hypothetical protein
MLYRDADGLPEQHDNVIDVVIVQSGEGTLVVGGKMINPKGGGGPGEYLGTCSSGQAQVLRASCGLHGHRVQLSARRCAIKACGASQRPAEPQVIRGRG